MPGVPARLLLTLFTVSFWFSIPVVSAQETGTRDLLNQIKELKSIVTIEADGLERRERDKLTIARGDVRIKMEDRVLYADEVELDQVQEVIRARGRVQLIEGAKRLDGDRFEYHYRKNTGVMYQARGTIPPATTFQGVEIHKEGERRYRVVEGSFTTCRICQPEPGGIDWEIRAKDAVLEQDEYLTANHASFWARGIPSLYSPYVIYPVGERRTGFLIPRIGYGDQDGFTYRQPFFWAIDESQDLTITGVYRSERGVEGDVIYRYIWGPEARGEINARVFQDRLVTTGDEVRATVTAWHDQQFNPELSLKADINYLSDTDIYREFTETPSILRTATFSNSRVFLTQLRRNYGLQFMVEETRSLSDTNDGRLGRLPDLTLSAFPQRLFESPVLFEMRASGTYLTLEGVPDSGRADLFPKLSLPWRILPWVTMTPSVGFRETAYTQHGTPGKGGTSRELFEASNSLEAWFYRSFQVGGERLDRLIHVVEPRVNYWYINPVDQQQLPQFDGVDFVSPQNRVTYSLTNRLLAKLKEADGSVRTREVVSLSLSQSYNLDPEERVFSDLFLNVLTPERIDQAVQGTAQPLGNGNGFSRVQERRFSNLVAAVRASPLQHLAFQGLVAINTEANRVDGVEAAARVTVPEYGWVEAGHTFVRDQQTGGVVGRFLLTPLKNVAINYLGRYDTFRDKNLEHNVAVTYSTCCWVMGIQYVHRSVTSGVTTGSDDSVYVLFDLLTGGVPSPPEWGARFLGRH